MSGPREGRNRRAAWEEELAEWRDAEDGVMRVLMLGWEFPPFIAGGLGVACHGLTKALDKLGHEVIFILPKPVRATQNAPAKLLSPETLIAKLARIHGTAPGDSGSPELPEVLGGGFPEIHIPGFARSTFRGVPAAFSSPYPGGAPAGWFGLAGTPPAQPWEVGANSPAAASAKLYEDLGLTSAAAAALAQPASSPAGIGYGTDLVGDAERYARLCVALARSERFDVIHAHDWLTYPAGLALAQVTGKPLVVHVHSTEFDRSGANVNQRIYNIERAGMHGAARVIAVSQFTRSICVRRYAVDPGRVDVVYNGLDREAYQPAADTAIEEGDKIVLFLGRLTMQKGPEYFIAAAKRVLEVLPDVKFVVAGSGDMTLRMIELAASVGIGHKVLFTGFLRGGDIDRVYSMADCYVMPSVSEPFGIAALEAIHHQVPVIVSKTSGVAEVLTHVLKVDFWDIDEMANKIVAVLRHPPLSQTLRQHGRLELHRLTWEGAAEKCLASYQHAIAMTTA